MWREEFALGAMLLGSTALCTPAVAQIGPGGQTVTDGVTTVTGVNTTKFTAGCAVTNGGSGTADAACSGSSGGTALQPANAVQGYSADPTGATDSTTAINSCLASTSAGVVRNCYLPSGTYLISNALNVGTATQGQCLMGDGDSTILNVTTSFNASANGVIVLNGQSPNFTVGSTPCVKNLQVFFNQPLDATNTVATASAAGSTTIVMNSVANVQTNDFVTDVTTSGAISQQPLTITNQATSTIVTAINGNTITISPAVLTGGTVHVGDTLDFSPQRASWTSLGSCSLTPGSAGCKYPYAVYGSGMGTPLIDGLLVQGAWNGLHLHGTTNNTNSMKIGRVNIGAMNVALDIDDIHNFTQIDDWELWNYGFDIATQGGNAMVQAYYDGSVVCGNLGASDGFTAAQFQCWTGKLNLTSNWSYGHFGELALDGKDSVLVAGGSATQWTHIDSMYSSGPFPTQSALQISSGYVDVGNYWVQTSTADPTTPISVTGGLLKITNGVILQGGTAYNAATVTGGELVIANSFFLHSAVAYSAPLVSSSAGVVMLTGNTVQSGGSGTAFSLVDNPGNLVTNNILNGWTFTPPGTQGTYQGGGLSGSSLTLTGAVTIDTGATNNISITGGSGGFGTLEVSGTYTTNGGFLLENGNGQTLLEVTQQNTLGAQVNFVSIGAAATTIGPKVYVLGSDTNISLQLATKGTGELQLGAHTAVTGGGTPTAPTCEGTGSVAGNDTVMKVTGGSTTSTTCTITFGNSWAAAPVCLVTDSTGAGALGALSWVTTTGSIVVTSATTDTAAVYLIHCVGTT